jgi:DNA-binding IclR family transcriptional regulator
VGTTTRLQTADDTLRVLEYLAESGRPRSLAAISHELNLTKARAYRILSTLKLRDYVLQDPFTRQYAFGPACARIVRQGQNSVSLVMACAEALRWLWEETGETAYFAVYQAGQAVVVDKIDSPKPLLAASALGRLLPLHAVSAGKALLASRPDYEVRKLIGDGAQNFTAGTRTEPSELWEEIRWIRAQGYAVNRQGWRDGVSGVAAPVRWGRAGTTVAAMAVCVPEVRFQDAQPRLTHCVTKAAMMASAALAPYAADGTGEEVQ